MTTTVSTPAGKLDLVEELRSLAAEYRLRDRAGQLERLADDLDKKQNLPRWAQISLRDVFLQDTLLAAPRKSTLIKLLDLLPGIMIFLPILMTWFGLQQATNAYRSSRGDQALVGMSFLEQWQTGFNGHLPGWLYFDRVALYTLALIIVMIFLSTWRSRAGWKAEEREESERENLLIRLTGVMAAVEFELAEYRLNDAAQLAAYTVELRAAAAVISDANDTARTTLEEARQGLAEVRGSLSRVKELAGAMLRAEKSAQDTMRKLGDTSEQIKGQLAALTDASGKIAEVTVDLMRSQSADRDQLKRALSDSGQEISTAISVGSRDLGASVSGALGQVGDGIREALDDWRAEGSIYSHRHENTTDRLGQFSVSLETLLDRITRSLDGLPAAVTRLEERTEQSITELDKTLASGADGIKNQLAQFLVGLPDAQARTDQVTGQMDELRSSIDQLSLQLRSAAADRPSGRSFLGRWFG